ncbi:MAG: hypothetical protein Terrestrivirus8_30 [Terrestrivirus sp.]|uniref:Uncharacterized protein n=1 Tax=Terrestrivirus sp. TaxID=2487775 RepID=A0A3G4ZNT4_9VIRU|nr:MAG: hypothetical protein Terrestrivirus8_30 [Terrestrivirus sp.]
MINTAGLIDDEVKYKLVKGIRQETDRYDNPQVRKNGMNFDKFCVFCNESTKLLNSNSAFYFYNNDNRKIHEANEFMSWIESFTSMIKTANSTDVKRVVESYNKYMMETA